MRVEEKSTQEAMTGGQVSQDLPFKGGSLCPLTLTCSYQPRSRGSTLFLPKEP